MRISKEKDISLSILQIITALFIILAPFAFNSADVDCYGLAMFLCTGVLFAFRFGKTKKMYFSLHLLTMLVLLFYSALSFLWVSNRGDHLVLMAVIGAVMLAFELLIEYFTETPEEKILRRMMYMFGIGGILCAFLNFLYWLTELVPFGKKEALSAGLGSNHFLAVFMMVSILSAALLVKGNKRIRQIVFVLGTALMLFVFIMCKSAFAWILLACAILAYAIGKKSKKLFFVISAAALCVFTVVFLIMFFASDISAVFKETFSYGTVFGRGGGFMSEREIFLSKNYTGFAAPGLLAFLYASLGLIGILCAIALIAKPVIHFIKLRTGLSAFNVILTLMIMFLPMAKNFTVLFFWTGLIAYNEKTSGQSVQRTLNLKNRDMKKIFYVAAAIGAITVFSLCQRFVVLGAQNNYDKGEYMQAYSLYSAASSMNVLDSESCLGAADALRKSGAIKEHYNEALDFTEKALKRDRNNIEARKLKAQICFACERYELAAQEYTTISGLVKNNGKYNFAAVEALYKIIENTEEGSPEALKTYEEIVAIAQATENLDYREKINNISDKALVYTRRRTED